MIEMQEMLELLAQTQLDEESKASMLEEIKSLRAQVAEIKRQV